MITISNIKQIRPSKVSDLICRNIREINSKDYGEDFINLLLKDFTPKRLLEKDQDQSILVAKEGEKIVGTGALENKGTDTETHFNCVAMFVLPEYHGRGSGSLLLKAVEHKARDLGVDKLTLRAAQGALNFYSEAGYHNPEGELITDFYGNFLLEKTL